MVIVKRAVMHDLRPLMGDVEAELEYYASRADRALFAYVPGSATLRQVTIGTGDRDLDDHEARSVAELLEVDVIDWESAAIAFVARQNGIPWLIVKGVSDMITSNRDTQSLHRSYAEGAELIMTRLLGMVGPLLERLPP